MRRIWLSLITFGILTACNGDKQSAIPTGPFTLVGTVTIVNDCDRQLASIPNNITVSASLKNGAGNVAIPGTTDIALVPVAGRDASKSGSYSITVQWPGGTAYAPIKWDGFTETLVGGGDICGLPNRCENYRCNNVVTTRTSTAPVSYQNDPKKTTNDVRIRCACSS